MDTPRRDGENRRKQIPKIGYIDTKFFFFHFVLLFAVDAVFFYLLIKRSLICTEFLLLKLG